MTPYRRIRLLVSTVRYLTVAQVWHRGLRLVRRRWRLVAKQRSKTAEYEVAPYETLYLGLPQVKSNGPWSAEVASAMDRSQALSRMEFSFLHRKVIFATEPDWDAPDQSHLWRYQLHYFDYLQDLLILGVYDPNAYATFRRLVRSWITRNEQLAGDGWHPYTMSRRIVNWLHAIAFFEKELSADEETQIAILSSLYGQARLLFSDLEFDVRGNHLLANLRALIWAGLAFKGLEARKWFTFGLAVLETEVAEQILADGGHFERSPGYHLVVFKDLIEIAVWLKRNVGEVPDWLEASLRRMHGYLWSILTPDGNIPLLKDSVISEAHNPEDLLAACAAYFGEASFKVSSEFRLYPLLLFGKQGRDTFQSWPLANAPRPSVDLPSSAHYVMRDDGAGDYLIFDAGRPCPDYLPAHAQADCLTFELASRGRRVIVDSGVYEYTEGEWRDFFRSTPAHNTVAVAGANQSQVWSSFRVGRRARPGPVRWQVREDYVFVQGEHDGYSRLPVPVIHQRTIVWGKKKFWLVVDQLWGRGQTSLVNYIHLHPSLAFAACGSGSWRISPSEEDLWLMAFGAHSWSIARAQRDPFRQGWYSEDFGELESNSVLALDYNDRLPHCFGYLLTGQSATNLEATKTSNGNVVTFGLAQETHTLVLNRGESPQFT
jgi:uncharacterized heparinase superfamily protein